jgi:hypothetical protein
VCACVSVSVCACVCVQVCRGGLIYAPLPLLALCLSTSVTRLTPCVYVCVCICVCVGICL